MWQFALLIFFISSCIFTGIMLHDSRSLWSGASLLFMMICLAVWPAIGNLGKNTMGITLYAIISFVVAYVLSLLAMYSIFAVLNLFHLRKKRNVDFIVVLGAGIIGSKVTPLVAARIEKG